MKYEPRLTEPESNNKNYIHYTHGGYGYCIYINNGSVLPNCVGYAWSRWREVLNKHHNLSRANAEMWYGNTADGYKRGKTPKLGAVICWRKGAVGNESDGAGHVAIVEQIKSDGTIVTSNSAYGGTRFYLKEIKPPYNFGTYVFQGFIYPPVEFTEGKYTTGKYKVTKVKTHLNVRVGPGTKYRIKKYHELAPNAQKQILKLSGKKPNGYVNGVEFDVSEVINDFWGKTPSGYVSLRYCEKIK